MIDIKSLQKTLAIKDLKLKRFLTPVNSNIYVYFAHKKVPYRILRGGNSMLFCVYQNDIPYAIYMIYKKSVLTQDDINYIKSIIK